MHMSDLFENRAAPLFHFMEYRKAMDMFANDRMDARWPHMIPGMGETMGNSFSRNPRFDMQRSVKLVIDKSILARTNKIVPLDGEHVFRLGAQTVPGSEGISTRVFDRRVNKNPLAEEFVVGPIKAIHRCIAQIVLLPPNFYILSGADAIRLQEEAERYSAQHGVPLAIHPNFTQSIAEIKQRWADEAADEEEDERAA